MANKKPPPPRSVQKIIKLTPAEDDLLDRAAEVSDATTTDILRTSGLRRAAAILRRVPRK